LSRLSRGNVSVHGIGSDECKYAFVNELVVDILTIAEASLFLKAELLEQACGREIGRGDLSFNCSKNTRYANREVDHCKHGNRQGIGDEDSPYAIAIPSQYREQERKR
jgi:hypothetical protein